MASRHGLADEARQAILCAHREAGKCGHHAISPLGLLVGMASVRGTAVAALLAGLGLRVDELRRLLAASGGREPVADATQPGYTAETQRVLRLASRGPGNENGEITSIDLLLGLLAGADPATRDLLRGYGLSLPRQEQAWLSEKLHGGTDGHPPAGGDGREPAEGRGGFIKVLEVPGRYVADHCLIAADGLVHLFYTNGEVGTGGDDLGNEVQIGHATSPDLMRWTACDPVLIRDASLPWEERGVFAPCVVEHQGRYLMFYSGHNAAGAQYMCKAASDDLHTWHRSEKNPVFVPSASWACWDAAIPSSCSDPHVLWHPDHGYIMYWVADMGNHKNHSCIAASVSPDLNTWREVGPVLIRHHSDLETCTTKTESPCVVRKGELYFLFFRHGAGTKVCASPDPLDFHGRDATPLCTAHAAEVFAHEGRWFVTHCSRPPSDVNHKADRTRGLYLGRLQWGADGRPRAV